MDANALGAAGKQRHATIEPTHASSPPLEPTGANQRLRLATVRGNELGEGRKLLPDKSDGRLVGDLASLVIDTLGTIADEDFRLVQGHCVEEHHRAAQIVLQDRKSTRLNSSHS